MIVLAILVTAALLGMAGITLVNLFTFPDLRAQLKPDTRLRVSLLVPARNEAQVIGATVTALLDQTYTNIEVLVLDDSSDDGTAEIARASAGDDSRLTVLTGAPLPAGWSGKTWACQQLAHTASGDVLIFTDADVRWEPEALTALLGEMERTNADMLTIWPTQQTETWAERLTVPLMSLVVLGYLPLPLVHHAPWSLFAAANGQCLAFRRDAYETIGGHEIVRGDVLEDVVLARRVKQNGFRLRMADGAGLIGCRMYSDWPSVRDGYAKNIIAGYGDSAVGIILATIFHWLVFVGPWVWLLAGSPAPVAIGTLAIPAWVTWSAWPLALIILGLAVRAVTAARTRQRSIDALLLPASVVLMTFIAGRALWWRWHYGGPQWKGRTIAKPGRESAQATSTVLEERPRAADG